MILIFKTHRVRTLDPVRSFLDGAEPAEVRPLDRGARDEFVARTLRRFRYGHLGKADEGVVRRFLGKVSGLSRAQPTRLIAQHRSTGRIDDRRDPPLARRAPLDRLPVAAALDTDATILTPDQTILTPGQAVRRYPVRRRRQRRPGRGFCLRLSKSPCSRLAGRALEHALDHAHEAHNGERPSHEGSRHLNVLEDPAIRTLWTVEAVRERSHELLDLGERGALEHFVIDGSRLDTTAQLVADITRERHPGLRIPLHSRWRHFERSDGSSRWDEAAGDAGLAGAERARSAVELAVVSVLLDAGAGRAWSYRDETTGERIGRSEGLALATFDLYRRGTLSSDPARPLRADAGALRRLDRAAFARAFQIGERNPLDGIGGRVRCLRSLSRAVGVRPEFERSGGAGRRLGHLFDQVRAGAPDGEVAAGDLLRMVLAALRAVIGRALGDVWFHPALRRPDATDQLLPLHKLYQWLTWSLIEPLAEGGVTVTGVHALTGLAEYRNGGLLLDTGVIAPRRPLPDRALSPGDPIVVEWRGLTVALLDRLRPRVAGKLGLAESELSIGQLLEGGTWWAGRRIAQDRREGGSSPIRLASDGTVF